MLFWKKIDELVINKNSDWFNGGAERIAKQV
jgi:hypothetical protein